MRKQYFNVTLLEMNCGYADHRSFVCYNKKELKDELESILKNYAENYEENYIEPISITIWFDDRIEIFGHVIKQDVKKIFDWHK